MRLRTEVGVHSITLLVRLFGGFAYLWTLSRLFGPEGNGIYALTLALSGYIGGFLAVGLPLSIIRATARDSNAPNERFGQFLGLFAITVASFGALIAVPQIGRWLGISDPSSWIAVVAGVATSGVANWMIGAALGRSELKLIASSSAAELFFRFGFLFLLAALLDSPAAGAYAWVASNVVHILLMKIGLRIDLRFRSGSKIRSQISEGISPLLAITLTALIRRGDVPIVASFYGLAVAGWYGLAATIADAAVTAPATLGQVLVARAVKRDDAHHSAMALLRWTLGLSIVLGAVLFFGAPLLIEWLFSYRYEKTGQLLQVMALGLVFSAGSAIILNHLVGKGVCVRFNVILGLIAALTIGLQIIIAEGNSVEWIAIIGASAQVVVFALFVMELRASNQRESAGILGSSTTANSGESNPTL